MASGIICCFPLFLQASSCLFSFDGLHPNSELAEGPGRRSTPPPRQKVNPPPPRQKVAEGLGSAASCARGNPRTAIYIYIHADMYIALSDVCSLSGSGLSLCARLVFVKPAFGRLSLLMKHMLGVCVLCLSLACHRVLGLYL
jgi:hypothetical protein